MSSVGRRRVGVKQLLIAPTTAPVFVAAEARLHSWLHKLHRVYADGDGAENVCVLDLLRVLTPAAAPRLKPDAPIKKVLRLRLERFDLLGDVSAPVTPLQPVR